MFRAEGAEDPISRRGRRERGGRNGTDHGAILSLRSPRSPRQIRILCALGVQDSVTSGTES